jgi:ribonuclease P protein component
MTRSKYFTIKWVANGRRHHPRLAVVISKKIFKSAVKRNRVRRRVYEIARPLLASAPAVDAVISVYAPEVMDAPHDELTIQLLPLLHEAGLKSHTIHE